MEKPPLQSEGNAGLPYLLPHVRKQWELWDAVRMLIAISASLSVIIPDLLENRTLSNTKTILAAAFSFVVVVYFLTLLTIRLLRRPKTLLATRDAVVSAFLLRLDASSANPRNHVHQERAEGRQ
ncbi:hypothetical protein [Sorangium sp. So ce1097]|uniref:hypothetical protein n=1 Tax=Sorangium sp. So ce1097 TaxID=3133330 RepID=UPI003F601C66